MAHEETVMEFMKQLIYATKHDIGGLMAHMEIFTAGTSAVNNAYKILNTLVDYGKLEKGGDYFKVKGTAGNHLEHSRIITAELVKILKYKYQIKIIRERFIEQVALIPDAMISTIDENKAAVWILEVMHNETQEYFEMKKRTWESWPEATDYLSKLFNIKVKSFNIINKAEEIIQ